MIHLKLTKKQTEVYKRAHAEDWFLLINHGAKRSGKTVINNLLFLEELKRVKEIAARQGVDQPQYILAGYALSNINQNILSELQEWGYNIKFDRFNNFILNGVKVVQTSTGDVRGVGRIRGMTAYGAYVNEASLCNPEVFDEIKSRCSGRGARIICDTNPDNPEHWLLKDYIDNENAQGTINFHFELDDNTFLDDRYRDNIKSNTPKGMFYDRAIRGLWVSGNGVVYSEFDREQMSVTRDEAFNKNYERFFAGVDWGFNHSTVITVFGYDNGVVTLMEEHAASHKQITHWIDVAQDIKERYGDIPFYCDTANSEHIFDLRQNGLNALKANKNVINGIEYVCGKMHKQQFKVVYDDCPQFQKEIYRYIWNDKTGGVVKTHDDCLDSMRYAIYNDYLDHVNQNTLTPDDLDALREYF